MYTLDRFDDQIIIPSLKAHAGFPTDVQSAYLNAEEINLDSYDLIILVLSGGKDSIACHLRMLDMGVDPKKIEFWHHDVDGNEGSELMDWPFMREYVRAYGEAFSVPVYFSWLKGGMEGEMLKDNAYSQPHIIETPDGILELPRLTTRSQPSSRLMFPQQSASLQTRWCSSSLKIDVGRRAITNQDRLLGKKILFVTGERRLESSNRAKYNQLERHMNDCRNGKKARHVDVWRPVLNFTEEQVWELMEKHGVLAPVPYRLGWNRSSCMTCIFNSPAIWATIHAYWPERTIAIAQYEQRFGKTISRSKKDVIQIGNTAQAFTIEDELAFAQASLKKYTLPVLANKEHQWTIPKGAFSKEACGSV